MTNGNSKDNNNTEDNEEEHAHIERWRASLVPNGNVQLSANVSLFSCLSESLYPGPKAQARSKMCTDTCWTRSVATAVVTGLLLLQCNSQTVLASTETNTNHVVEQLTSTLVPSPSSLNSAILNSNEQLDEYSANVTTLPLVKSMMAFPSNGNNTAAVVDSSLVSEDKDKPPVSATADPEYVYFRTTVRFWVQRVLVPVIMVVGFVGNSITIVIMTRRRMRSSTNWYLAALAIFDMIYLVFTFILSLKHYPNAHDLDYYLYWYLFPFSMMITDASSNTSVWLTVTFTIERYIAVCHPIKGKVICTESRAKRVILCVFLVCVSVTVPTPFEWIVIEGFDPKTNQTRMEATFSELGQNATYKSIYYHLNVILFVLLPLILLVIFNSFLIRSVHQSTKQRSKMVMGKDSPYQKGESSSSPSSSRQEIRITIMLIAVVILFIICQTPTACILVYTVFHSPDPASNEEYLLTGLSNIFNFLMSINAAGNFVLYCLLSQKYRRTFVNMFCPCLVPKYLRAQSTYPRVNVDSVAPTVHSVHQTHPHAHIHHHRFNDSKKNGNTSGGVTGTGGTAHSVSNHVTSNNYRATSTSSSSISTNHDSGSHHHRNHQPSAHYRHSPSSSMKLRSAIADHRQQDYLPKNGTEVPPDQSHILLLDHSANGGSGQHQLGPQLSSTSNTSNTNPNPSSEHRLISSPSSVDN